MMLNKSFKVTLSNKNQGFSLMEVLISMIVIAIGLLGYMALQLASINSNQEGLARSQATLIAQDISSLMRADRDFINTPGAGNDYLNANFATACGAGISTPTAQPAFNIWTICMSLEGFTTAADSDNLLPEGKVYLNCSDVDTTDADACSPGSLQTISVLWRQSAARQDVGQVDVAMNARCAVAAGVGGMSVADQALHQCVLLDLIP